MIRFLSVSVKSKKLYWLFFPHLQCLLTTKNVKSWKREKKNIVWNYILIIFDYLCIAFTKVGANILEAFGFVPRGESRQLTCIFGMMKNAPSWWGIYTLYIDAKSVSRFFVIYMQGCREPIPKMQRPYRLTLSLCPIL